MDSTILTIASIPAVLALVNLAKALGLPAKLSIVLAILAGVAGALAEYAWSGQGWWAAARGGLILGLSAAGLYDVAKTVAPTVAVEADVVRTVELEAPDEG